jgi:N-acetyltransferase
LREALDVPLEGAIVRLEPVERRHTADLLAAAQDGEVWPWISMAGGTPQESLARWLEFARGDDVLVFATVRVADGRAIGGTSYLEIHPEHLRVEVGGTWLGAIPAEFEGIFRRHMLVRGGERRDSAYTA